MDRETLQLTSGGEASRRALLEKASLIQYSHPNADSLHHYLWGDRDVQTGLYESKTATVADACDNAVVRMAQMLPANLKGKRVLNIGSGYGGAARYLARSKDCRVNCVNRNEVQSAINRNLVAKEGLIKQVEVIDCPFEELPFSKSKFDAIWSHDAFINIPDRTKVIHELNRVLRPGGMVILADIMQAEDLPDHSLASILRRLDVPDLGSVSYYMKTGIHLGWQMLDWTDLSENLFIHCQKVESELLRQKNKLRNLCGQEYMKDVCDTLGDWIAVQQAGYLRWGFFVFKKHLDKDCLWSSMKIGPR